MLVYSAMLCVTWPWRLQELTIADVIVCGAMMIMMQAAQGLAPAAEGAEADFLAVMFVLSVSLSILSVGLFVLGGSPKAVTDLLRKGHGIAGTPEALIQFLIDVAPSAVHDFASIRKDCESAFSELQTRFREKRLSRRSQTGTGKAGGQDNFAMKFDSFVLVAVSKLNNYALGQTESANQVAEHNKAVTAGAAFFKTGVRSVEGGDFPALKISQEDACQV